MSAHNLLKMSAEQAKEMPMVDLAFQLLKVANTPYYYRDLMAEIAKIKGLSDEEIMQVIAQLYTEINIDGRFACVGTNLWGLKRWYPIEKSEDAVGSGKRPRIINDEDDDDDEEIFAEEEDAFVEEEDFDSYDSPRDEFDSEEEIEEETEFFEDEEIDEEDSESAGSDDEDESDDDLDEQEDDDSEKDSK